MNSVFVMTATLTEPVESLLREQVANGQFPSIEVALETAVRTVFGRTATPELELLLDEALSHPGERVPLAQLLRESMIDSTAGSLSGEEGEALETALTACSIVDEKAR